MTIKIGDRVERIAPGKATFKVGETGVVIDVRPDNIDVELDDGSCSMGNSPSKLKVIKTPMLKRLGNFMRTILDKETQVLVKAGYLNGDLEPTEKGRSALESLVFADKKTELVALAQAEIDEAKEDCK